MAMRLIWLVWRRLAGGDARRDSRRHGVRALRASEHSREHVTACGMAASRSGWIDWPHSVQFMVGG